MGDIQQKWGCFQNVEHERGNPPLPLTSVENHPHMAPHNIQSFRNRRTDPDSFRGVVNNLNC